jgi:AmiR/NasT family two-component response regulator
LTIALREEIEARKVIEKAKRVLVDRFFLDS